MDVILPESPKSLPVGATGAPSDVDTKSSSLNSVPAGISGMPAQVKFLNNVVLALVLVLFIGFAAMFVAVGQMMIDSWVNKASTFRELEDRIQEQSHLLELMAGKLKIQIPESF